MTFVALLSSRAGDRYLACLAGCGLLSALLSGYGLKIQMTMQYPAVVMGIPELCAVLLTCLGVILLRPRMWILDRLGAPSRRWIPATGAAIATLAGPQLVLALAAAGARQRDTWGISATTILFLAGLAVLVTPFIGALRAGGLIPLLYFSLVMAAQSAPMIKLWAPVAVITWPAVEPPALEKVVLAIVTTGVALTVTVRTLGRTMRTWGRDSDTT